MPKTNDNKTSDLMQVLKNEMQIASWPKEGSVVEATLIKKLSREAYFDLDKFGTGIVYGSEMINAREMLKNINVGDKVPAKIINIEGEEGYVELSLAEASKQKLWQRVKDLAESGDIVKAKIAGANAGGLMATLKEAELRAFLPVSQLSVEHYPRVNEGDRQGILEELKKFIGQELDVKIIDVNPRNNKIIVSEREVLSSNLKEALGKYEVGQVIDGIVSGIANFGVFVRFADNPDIEGMVHISELDHRLIENPKEIVKVSDEIKAKIIDIKEGRVFLSLKALKPDPWERVSELFKEGTDVDGMVYKLNPFGGVINLPHGLQGLIHVSAFGGQEEMKAALRPGESYKFAIESIKPEEKRIILKLKK